MQSSNNSAIGLALREIKHDGNGIGLKQNRSFQQLFSDPTFSNTIRNRITLQPQIRAQRLQQVRNYEAITAKTE
jgi:hypothetical protein